jgi:hypothetical protein
MPILYSHRQFGRAVFFVAIGVAVLVGGIVPLVATSGTGHARGGPGVWLLVTLSGIVPLVLLLMFSSLRVTVDGERLAWAFGMGFPNYSIRLGDITGIEVVRTSLMYGIGIRITPKGRLSPSRRESGLSS